MAKSINVERKKRGRPATGMDPNIGIRLPEGMIAAVDADAAAKKETRSEAIRRILTDYLKRRGWVG
jgi:metal-responsive CopG/Arc/MetJ family transcriptional regulator